MSGDLVVRTLVLGMLETNTYVVFSHITRKAIIIDPAWNPFEIEKVVEADHLEPSFIILTHGHADHIGAVDFLKKKYKSKTAVHSFDKQMTMSPKLNLSEQLGLSIAIEKPDIELKDGDGLNFGESIIRIIHTPGHTKGGVCLYTPGMLFSGDTLFQGAVGRCDLPGSSTQDLSKSLKKLMKLTDGTAVYPGHGPSTTIGGERNNNLCLKELLNLP